MPWTTPKTWALDDLLDQSTLNTHIRDNLDYLYTSVAVPSSASGYVSFTNTTTETTLHTLSLGANALGANGTLHIYGAISMAHAGTFDMTLRIKLGSTTIFAIQSNITNNGATALAMQYAAFIVNQNNAASQRATFYRHTTGSIASASSTATTATSPTVALNTATVDTTSAQTLAITAQMTSSGANQTVHHHGAIVYYFYKA